MVQLIFYLMVCKILQAPRGIPRTKQTMIGNHVICLMTNHRERCELSIRISLLLLLY